MKLIFFLSIILLYSCESKKQAIVNRQQSIMKEMEDVKTHYYKKSDSLESIKHSDTNSVRQTEIATELISADKSKNAQLIPLQNEYDSLEIELKKY